MREKTIETIIKTFGFLLMITAIISIGERDKKQTEQIKILEQSLNEQIQEKEVYLRMLELKGEE